MAIKTVGVMSPGSMGKAIAQQLKRNGFEVCTALDGRSDRSRKLAAAAAITDLGTLDRLAAQCDVILSIMNPGAALEFAQNLASAIKRAGTQPLVVDCNAIAPTTMQAVHAAITASGARCLDAGMFSPPPGGGAHGRLFLSGPGAEALKVFATADLSVRVLNDRIGAASALKMLDAVISKGVTALVLQMLIAAERYGVGAELEEQLTPARQKIHGVVIDALPIMPPKAYRWVPEVLEIAKTLETVGMTPRMIEGAAEVYEFVAATALGRETPESRDRSLDGRGVVRQLAGEPW
jgi:3-hydroxyisobutyrate dehydrogenase-like beta-hydroxyacid dehydrogenase